MTLLYLSNFDHCVTGSQQVSQRRRDPGKCIEQYRLTAIAEANPNNLRRNTALAIGKNLEIFILGNDSHTASFAYSQMMLSFTESSPTSWTWLHSHPLAARKRASATGCWLSTNRLMQRSEWHDRFVLPRIPVQPGCRFLQGQDSPSKSHGAMPPTPTDPEYQRRVSAFLECKDARRICRVRW